jgi:hypothetical protein
LLSQFDPAAQERVEDTGLLLTAIFAVLGLIVVGIDRLIGVGEARKTG